MRTFVMKTKENIINVNNVEDFELAVLLNKQKKKQETTINTKWIFKALLNNSK